MAQRIEDLIHEYQARKSELDKEGVYFLRDITDDAAERFSKAILVMASQRRYAPQQPIVIYINSGGGSVGAGMAIIEMIHKVKRDFGVRVDTVITGYAYSMGAIIFQAGDHRVMGAFSTMMLHSASWVVAGEDDKIFRDYAKLSRIYKRMVGDLFAQRTGRQDARWWERFIYSGRDKFLSAPECLELGLVDEVATTPLAPPKVETT